MSFGLVVTQTPFEFMAMLAFLSLTGMLIKNAIVLVDQIDLEIREGKPRLRAVLESSRSRVRPVAMGAITTILGWRHCCSIRSSNPWRSPSCSVWASRQF
ncbi:efflux RND transporter permease subunit [Plesiomonas shigelloides subsp. oncorhynchi]|nr:efflux RND transporter permease subunit [Plesiomonas shigelloides]